ncbi:unnamed protein product [Vitrella brassicaformis CCMP3155]|uniref:Uncharacterized protein n=2 Tax=Vitrella brassicaformis TaxID=1169539 RepID=A0A0G4EPT3_VITBC|nr:unnamed protein product [Vitrella brassicaformis CCMP3155]|mmetsp:Transcript_46605/g.116099  ORF Transcript_46605/g.116099 Transcript_46605/m.116099 type:complete len:614 (+) Transcript_46605:183-2024(+)|eukprot:CEL99275.1 unnamed protein product [Vitrella brassicaformis CCMP3155]
MAVQPHFELSNPNLYLSGLCIFVGGILASAAGIGGGGIFVALLMVIEGFSAYNAVPLSKAMIFAGSVLSFILLSRKKHPETQAPLIHFDLGKLMVPMALSGTLFGVYLNFILPEWVLVSCLVTLLSLVTLRTIHTGISKWREEQEAFKQRGTVRELVPLSDEEDRRDSIVPLPHVIQPAIGKTQQHVDGSPVTTASGGPSHPPSPEKPVRSLGTVMETTGRDSIDEDGSESTPVSLDGSTAAPSANVIGQPLGTWLPGGPRMRRSLSHDYSEQGSPSASAAQRRLVSDPPDTATNPGATTLPLPPMPLEQDAGTPSKADHRPSPFQPLPRLHYSDKMMRTSSVPLLLPRVSVDDWEFPATEGGGAATLAADSPRRGSSVADMDGVAGAIRLSIESAETVAEGSATLIADRQVTLDHGSDWRDHPVDVAGLLLILAGIITCGALRHHLSDTEDSTVLTVIVVTLPTVGCVVAACFYVLQVTKLTGWRLRQVAPFPCVAFLTGICSGLLGIGGGLIFSPFFVFMGVDPMVTVSTASFCVVFTATSTTSQYLLSNRVPRDFAVFYGAITTCASFVGVKLVHYIQKKTGRKSFVIVVVGVAVGVSAILACVKFVAGL